MAQELAIDAVGLEKSYGDVRVLEGVNLQVGYGTVLSLLGPNGAGKTTTVRILSTLTAPDAGQALVAGHDVVREARQVRRRISLTGQDVAIDGLQTGEENLRMMGHLHGLSGAQARVRARELLVQFGLADVGGRLVARYSGGMRRRLDLAAGLVGRPLILFLDEPSSGLDLPSRLSLWATIAELARSGMTIFLTTQYLEEADQLADLIAVFNRGKVVGQGTPAELKRQVGGQRLNLTCADGAAFEKLTAVLGQRAVHVDAARLTVSVPTDGLAEEVRCLLDEVDPSRRLVERFTVTTSTLDDVFLTLTDHAADVEEMPGV